MNITWNADRYSENFSFVHQYGRGVLDLVKEGHGGLAVDLGCGNGALTPELAKKGYRVVGVDASPEMLAIARRNYPDFEFVQADAREFSLSEKADVIFSNAVIHWIDRSLQEELAANISSQLKIGGQFVCEFGGYGCAEAVHSTLERLFNERGLKYPRTFFFPTIGEYAPILERNGLRVLDASLFERPTVQKTEHGVIDWIMMFVTKPFEGMAADLRNEILNDAERALKNRLFVDGKWIIDYMRIRISAVRV